MRILLVFLFLFSVIQTLSAQQIKRFDDHFGLKGEVRYFGAWNDTILPNAGNFEFTWRELDNNDIHTYRTKGRLNNNVPDGNWIWEEARWKYTVEAGRNLAPMFHSIGEHKAWEGGFVKGVPNGQWTFVIDSLNQSQKRVGEGLLVNAEFKVGQVVGELKVRDKRPGKRFELTGMCDASGIATGAWEYKQFDSSGKVVKSEIRHYYRGVLVKVLKPNKYTSLTDSLSTLEKAIVEADQVWNGIPFEIGEHIFDNDGFQSDLNKLADYYLVELIYDGWQHELFNHTFLRKGPGYKQIKFPFAQSEKEAIAQSDSLIKVIQEELGVHLTNRKIALNRARSAEFDLAIDYVQKSALRISAIDSLLNLTNDQMFEYRNRFDAEVLGWNKSLTEPSLATALYFEKQEQLLPVPNLEKQKFEVFDEIYATLNALYDNLKPHFQIIDSTNTLLTRESELQVLEEEIASKQQTADSVYVNRIGLTAHIASIWLDDKMGESMRKYAQTDDFTQARLQANRIINQLDTLTLWQDKWTQIDAMYANLSERYTHRLYNPYTGKHDIEMKVKKRFFIHFEQQLLPYMMGGLVEITDWGLWVNHVVFCFDTYSDLMDFALIEDNSSRKLDQRFRKEKNPERMARLLSAFMTSHRNED